MIYLFCPLYPEAGPLIRHYHLKKKNPVHGIDSFTDETGTLLLTLTGSGNYNAIAAVSSILAVRPPARSDFFVLFGSAAGIDPIRNPADSARLWQLCEICDLASGRHSYPDLIWNLGLPLAGGVTGMKVMRNREEAARSFAGMHLSSPVLYDMESAGMYEAASRHMDTDQMIFLRFVSDQGEKITASVLRNAAENAADEAIRVLTQLQEISAAKSRDERPDTRTGEENVFAGSIHASEAMRRQLHQLIRYAEASGIDWRSFADDLSRNPGRDRREGKKVLDAFRQKILDA